MLLINQAKKKNDILFYSLCSDPVNAPKTTDGNIPRMAQTTSNRSAAAKPATDLAKVNRSNCVRVALFHLRRRSFLWLQNAKMWKPLLRGQTQNGYGSDVVHVQQSGL